MNYVFSAAAIAFSAGDRVSPHLVEGRPYNPYPGINATQFSARIRELACVYDWETTQVQFNLLDSHDVPRVVSIARGDKATLRLATLLQMTFPGASVHLLWRRDRLAGCEKRYDHVYRDQDARWPFPWHDKTVWDCEMLDFFRQVILLRHAHPALRLGQFDEVYAREIGNMRIAGATMTQTLLVVLNAGDDAAQISVPLGSNVPDGASLTPIFGAAAAGTVAGGHAALGVPPRTGCVYLV